MQNIVQIVDKQAVALARRLNATRFSWRSISLEAKVSPSWTGHFAKAPLRHAEPKKILAVSLALTRMQQEENEKAGEEKESA